MHLATDGRVRGPIRRFGKYVDINTRSVHPPPGQTRARIPSSPGQDILSKLLVEDLIHIGLKQGWIRQLEDKSILAQIPATPDYEDRFHPVFAAHMDSFHGTNAENVKPQYYYVPSEGQSLTLPSGQVIPSEDFEGLKPGQQIIAAGGPKKTLLGSDDKAGLVILIEAIKWMLANNIPHGPITLWLCVDEELGELDTDYLPDGVIQACDYLITLDSTRAGAVDVGGLICNRVSAIFTGDDEHPAHAAAMALGTALMGEPTPMETSGDEAFYYVGMGMGDLDEKRSGDSSTPFGASEANMTLLGHDFPEDQFETEAQTLKALAEQMAKSFGAKVEVSWEDSETPVTLEFSGEDAHPGVDADKLHPAHYAALWTMRKMDQTWQLGLAWGPEPDTEFDPLYHPMSARKASMVLAPRSFDTEESAAMTEKIHELAKQMAERFGVELEFKDQPMCDNPAMAVEKRPELIELVEQAHRHADVIPFLRNVRGGTDIAILRTNDGYKAVIGLNLGVGGRGLHGYREFLVVDEFLAMIRVLKALIVSASEFTPEKRGMAEAA